MKSSFYREKWSRLFKNRPGAGELRKLSRQIAYSFLDYYLKDCHYESDYIDLLCEMTTFSDDPSLNHPGSQALFGIIIESLCDDFEALQTETYNRVMTQVISFCRKIQAGRELDQKLTKYHIHSSDDLIHRISRIRGSIQQLPPAPSVKKILLLSRVTIGADVAITSIVIQRLSKLYPNADIVLIGGNKLADVYGGNSRIKIREAPYVRRGGLLERLSGWHDVLDIIRKETASSPVENTILVDPDSRFSQLGVLPLIDQERYYFFDSRSDTAFNRKMSMVELTNDWLDAISGEKDFHYPVVWAPAEYLKGAQRISGQLRKNGAKNIFAVNFGVGGNRRKRVGEKLEEKLLMMLLKEPDTVVCLDKGFGEEELACADALMDTAAKNGYPVLHATFISDIAPDFHHGIIGMQTKIGEMAGLIQHADEYIGYDSACQHIAAALGTPCVTIFAGSNNMRFIRRWSAHGKGKCHIVHVDTITDPELIDVDNIITRIMNVRNDQGA